MTSRRVIADTALTQPTGWFDGGKLTFTSGLNAGAAYAREAKDVDPPSAAIITPYVSWMAFGNLIAAELWRRNVGKHGVD